MYLRNIYIENNGPLRSLSINLPFGDHGVPKPVILVGKNGSGKTNLLSIITDSFFELAATHFQDVVPNIISGQRPWYRVVGGATRSFGQNDALSLLRFKHEEKEFFFIEQSGSASADSVRTRVPSIFYPCINWGKQHDFKSVTLTGELSKSIFDTGAYLAFPSNRAEIPHWLNKESVPDSNFFIQPSFSNRLKKPFYLESGISSLKQWLLGLLLDTRVNISTVINEDTVKFSLDDGTVSALTAMQFKNVWDLMNDIARLIFDNEHAKIKWLGHYNSNALGIELNSTAIIPTLNALSSGQAIAFNIFGNLLRYIDTSGRSRINDVQSVPGICLIDEIDAHMHIDLQYNILPNLIKMFPKIQFIVSTHSPLFVLGMAKNIGADNISIVELPSGISIDPEAYKEFEHALQVVADTKAFSNLVSEEAGRVGKMLLLCEGETDPIYIKTAIELAGRDDILIKVDIQWVGAKDHKGQGIHSGINGLNHTFNTLRANPDFMRRRILLLYDSDANKSPLDEGNLLVRCVPGSTVSSKVTTGIERLLPDTVFTSDIYDTIEKSHPDGSKVTKSMPNKMRLCKYVCETRRDASDFIGFSDLITMLDEIETVIKCT